MNVFGKIAFCACVSVLAEPAIASTAVVNPVVVELFTSQGCSSCPPANANLAAVASRPDVLALSFNVTYWDQLGWKDTFAKPEYTTRQVTYERALGHESPFTPQIVVNGTSDTVGDRLTDVNRLIASARTASGPSISVEGSQLVLGDAPAREADIWLVRYDPRTLNVPVGAGENEGVTLPHKNVVRALSHLGSWSGHAERLVLPAPDAALATAILVQGRHGGPILASYKE